MQPGKAQIECPDNVTISDIQYSIKYYFNSTGLSTILQNGFYGTSGAVYYVATHSTTRASFSKEDVNGTLEWAKTYTGHYTFQRGNAMLSDESKIYSLREDANSVVIFEISTTDGSLLNRYEDTNYRTTDGLLIQAKIVLSPDDSFMYYSAINVGNTRSVICKWTLSGTSTQCTDFTTATEIEALTYISATHVYFSARANSKPNFVLLEWENTTPVWQVTRACLQNTCFHELSHALLSTDEQTIYTATLQNWNRKIVWVNYNLTDASIVGTTYAGSANGITRVWDLKYYNTTNIIMLAKASSTAILYNYNITDDSWGQSYSFPTAYGSFIQGDTRNTTWILGQSSNHAYKIGFFYDWVNVTDISTSTHTMTAYTTGWTEGTGAITVGAFANYTFSTAAGTETEEDAIVEINNSTSWETNIHTENTTAEFTVDTGATVSEDFGGTCTTTPARTAITYSMTSNEGETVPSWITLNEDTGKYEGTAPEVTETTVYSFVLNSSWTVDVAGSESQIVKFTVEPEPVVEEAGAVAIASAGAAAGAAVSAINSAISGNPPTGLYFILHQLQMIILFLMIDPFIPDTMKTYLEGQGFALVTFNFIPSADIPGIDIPVDWMEAEQPNELLESLGIESKSTFVNNLSFILTIFGIMILHMLLRFVFVCGARGRGKCAKFWTWLRLKLIDIIKYALYMRLFIESHEAMLLSATNEIYLMDLKDFSDVFSMIVAFIILGFSIAMPVIAFYCFFVNRHNFDPEKKFFFMEFFADLRDAKIARLYMTLLLTRRIVFVSFVIFLPSAPRELTYTVLLASQLVYILALLIMRPFDSALNNIIEMVNELFLLIVTCMLFAFSDASKWTGGAEDAILNVLMINAYLVVVIMIGGLIAMIIHKCVSKKGKGNNSTIEVTPKEQIEVKQNRGSNDLSRDEEEKDETEGRMNQITQKEVDQTCHTGTRLAKMNRIKTPAIGFRMKNKFTMDVEDHVDAKSN